LRQSFSACVYCMQLRFQSNYIDHWLAQTKVITLNTQTHAVNARWKRLSQRSFNVSIYACLWQGWQVGLSSFTKNIYYYWKQILFINLDNRKCNTCKLTQRYECSVLQNNYLNRMFSFHSNLTPKKNHFYYKNKTKFCRISQVSSVWKISLN